MASTVLDTHQSAEILGVSTITLRNSRITGILCGVKAPQFKKMGRKVIYERAELETWLNDLPSFNNLSEVKYMEGA